MVGQSMSVQGGEKEDEEDKAVFAAVVGKGEFGEAARVRSQYCRSVGKII